MNYEEEIKQLKDKHKEYELIIDGFINSISAHSEAILQLLKEQSEMQRNIFIGGIILILNITVFLMYICYFK